MIKLPTREDFERLVKINTERNEWNREYYAHLPARQQWKAWQTAIAEVQRLNATAQPVSEQYGKISDELESLLWPNMASGNKEIIDAAIQTLRATPEQPVSDGWVKCSESMPEEMSDVLVTDGKNVKDMWWNGKKWDSWADRYSLDSDFITHWMPLPAAPGGQDG